MKRKLLRITGYIIAILVCTIIGITIAKAVQTDAETDEFLKQTDEFIERYERRSHEPISSDSNNYGHHLVKHNLMVNEQTVTEEQTTEEPTTEPETEPETTEPDVYAMDVWTLGSYLYGISELDTNRSLKLISYEGYGNSQLSYYVACCCWTRCTNGYLGIGNGDLYTSFGGADPQYNLWMDDLGIAEYAYEALRQCYLNPVYVTSCNGMTVPSEYVYAEWTDCGMIYVW